MNGEIDAIVNSGLQVRLLRSPDLQRIIAEASIGEYDLLWLAGHFGKTSTDEGLALENGDLLAVAQIVQVVRLIGCSGVVLNSCSSAKAAQQITYDTAADVICTIEDVESTQAYATGASLARMLVKTDGDLREAFQAARPGANQTYRYFKSSNDDTMAPRTYLEDQVNEIMRVLLDDDLTQKPGLITELRQLNTSLRDHVSASNAQMDLTRKALDDLREVTENRLARVEQRMKTVEYTFGIHNNVWLGFVGVSVVILIASEFLLHFIH